MGLPPVYILNHIHFAGLRMLTSLGGPLETGRGRYLWGEFVSTLVGTLGITRGVKDFGRAFKDYQYILGVARGG